MNRHLHYLFVFIVICLICLHIASASLNTTSPENPAAGKISGVIDKQIKPSGIIPAPALSPSRTDPVKTGISEINPVNTTNCETCVDSVRTEEELSTENLMSIDAVNQEIEDINEYIDQHDMNWTAGITSVSYFSDEAYEQLLGAVPQEIPGAVMQIASTPVDIQSLPASFDWRNNGGDWTTPIRNQGGCGSCWAFASTGVFESYQERRYGNPNLNPDYSEQYLVSCNQNGWSCSGGWISFPYFINTAGKSGGVGTVTEGDYPYTATTSGCKSLSGYVRYSAPAGAYWSYAGSSSGVPSVDQIKSAIYTHGPVFAGIAADNYFKNYRNGVFSGSSTNMNHAVIIVGWGSDARGTYWICKNSWGTGWGESGWFRIYAGSNLIGYSACYMYLPDMPAPTISSITPSSGARNSTVAITNLSGSNFQTGLSVLLTRAGYNDITGTNVALVSTSQVTCSFPLIGSTPGKWKVLVVNPDGKSANLTDGFSVVSDVKARFYGVPEPTVHPLTIRFFDVSVGNPVSRTWSFGDGTHSTESSPTKTYTEAGTYTVTLAVDDGYEVSSEQGLVS
ncbi:C1 family peptidase [Methanospirillum stamsii]|nr:C1 family peptidase [Methanospirillum stamsii]